jgi:hypothetical protein
MQRKESLTKIKNSSPVFIIGSQRSGTSFLYRTIQNYLPIRFGRDNGFFLRKQQQLDMYGDLQDEKNLRRLLNDILKEPDIKKRFPGLKIDIDEFVANIDEPTYPELVRLFYAEWALLGGFKRWGGKTPDYSIYANELYELFPDAKFIHIIRDGRDVALSLFNVDWGPKSPVLAAKHWKARVESARSFGKKLNENQYLELRYEILVQHPETVFRKLIHFLEWEGDREAIIEDFEANIGQYVKRNNFDKWRTKMPPRHRRLFELTAGDLLKQLGYETTIPNEYLGKGVSLFGVAVDAAENFWRKLVRGEVKKGLAMRIGRFWREFTLRIRLLFS